MEFNSIIIYRVWQTLCRNSQIFDTEEIVSAQLSETQPHSCESFDAGTNKAEHVNVMCMVLPIPA